ncbi:MAG: membrane protein insertase YidC [Candidatus Aminicenantes bacterium]|nr:membrane protein insertase YidC [Candidatus Aminicenantes bacterium]
MEKRLLFAIVLSFLVIFAYQALFVKKQPPQQTEPYQASEQTSSPEPSKENEPPIATQPQVEEQPFEPLSPVSAEKETDILVETPLFRAVWSNKGAVLKSFLLYLKEEEESVELVANRTANQTWPFSIRTEYSSEYLKSSMLESPLDKKLNQNVLYDFSTSNLLLRAGETGELRLIYADEEVQVEKKFIFNGDSYHFSVNINVRKNGRPIDPQILWGPGFGSASLEEQKGRFVGGDGAVFFNGQKASRYEEKKYKERQGMDGLVWAAYESNYFAALFLPSRNTLSASFFKDPNQEALQYYLAVDGIGEAFIGPKEYDTLSSYGHQSKKLIRFGLFGWIAEILLKTIKAVHSVFPNWGISIMIMTLIIKVLFFPLTYSSTKSMAKMQEIQPKIKALRNKYKKAKQDMAERRKMNEEMMKLYKEQGINPAGGCFPMLIQIPIFWGFFQLLRVSIEFRKSPFILWIKDLSVKDPYYITPILMGITQYISQKMTPTAADNTQQKMMLILPVVMTIFFLNFQSGLILYWLTNNLLQIVQQSIMNKMMHKKKSTSHGKQGKQRSKK